MVLRRLAAAVPLLLGILTLSFFLLESAPGDPADLLLGERPVPPEVRERIATAYGLDRPAGERYLLWLRSVLLQGELGWSVSRSRPVASVLMSALPATLALAGAALLIHVIAGITVALLSARGRGRWTDRALSAGSLALYAMPTFWLAMMAILAFAYKVPIFPASSIHSVGAATWPLTRRLADLAWHIALPAAVLGLASAASLSRFVREGILEALGEDFIRAARARGVGDTRVLLHALRNSLLPAISLVGLSLPLLVSGSVVVEVVFAWPGMGRVAYEAILGKDLPLVLSATLLSAALVILGNLAADLGLALADPRIRIDRRGRRR